MRHKGIMNSNCEAALPSLHSSESNREPSGLLSVISGACDDALGHGQSFSEQAPHSKVTASWMHPHVHSLDGLRQSQHPATAGPGFIALSPN